MWSASAAASASTTPKAGLVWQKDDPNCLGREALAELVEKAMQRAVFELDAEPAPGSHFVVGRIGESRPGRYEARVAMIDEAGRQVAERVLNAEGSCGRLDESVAVVVALMLDNSLKESAPTLPEAAASPAAAPAPMPGPPAADPGYFLVALGGGATLDLLPRASAELSLRGGYAPNRTLSFELSLHATPAVATVLRGASIDIDARLADLRGCVDSGRNVAWGLCAGVGFGGLRAQPTAGLVDAQQRFSILAYGALAPHVKIRMLGPTWIRFEPSLRVLFHRETLGVLDQFGTYVPFHVAGRFVPSAALWFEVHSD